MTVERLTVEDVDQIVQGIEEFIIGPVENYELQTIWQPYIDKLKALQIAIGLTFDPTNHHNALLCPYCNPDKLVLVREVTGIRPFLKGETAVEQLAWDRGWRECAFQAREAVEQAQKEIEVDNQLLAEHQRLLDLFDCPAHGKGCIPHAIEEVTRLRQNQRDPATT